MHSENKNQIKRAFECLKVGIAEKKKKMAAKEVQASELQKKRQYFIDKIKVFEKSVTGEKLSAMTKSDLEGKSERLSELQGKFDEICALLNSKDEIASTIDDDEVIEEQCAALKSMIIRRIHELNSQENETVQAQTSNAESVSAEIMQNAPIQIQNTWGVFTGNYFDWHRFAERFKVDVHENTNLDDSKKNGNARTSM